MHINELSILVSAILSVAVGTIWYSPIIFGSRYVKHTHGAPSVYDSKKTIAETVVHILFAFVFFYVLAYVYAVLGNYEVPLVTVVGAIVALIISSLGIHTVKEHASYIAFLIHAGYMAGIICGGSAVLILWPW